MVLELAALYFRAMKNPVGHPPSPFAFARADRHLAPLVVVCGVLGLLTGCATAPVSHVVSAPPPLAPTSSVTTTTTTTTPTGMATTANATPVVSTTVVTQAPPTLQEEARVAQPSARHIWLAGYWTWRNERYEWMAGQWEMPPTASSIWVAPRWESQGNAYRFYEGYWN